MDIGTKIKNARIYAGLTQEQAAEALGVSRQTISNWENERTYPDIVSVVKMSDLYHISLDHLKKRKKPASDYLDYLGENTDVVKRQRRLSMLLNLTIGGNVFGAALMLYDLWQQTYYHIPIIVGLFIQIGMCALFLGLCSSIRPHDPDSAQDWRTRYWRCNIFSLALMPCFWASSILLHILAQKFAVSSLLLLPVTLVLYLFVCLRVLFRKH